MTNAELWQQYQTYTKTVTELVRKLGFAAAAICWFFKDATGVFPTRVLSALFLVVLFFVADVLQFLAGAVMLRCWTRQREKELWNQNGTLDGDYEKPVWLDYPSYAFWWGKILLLLYAFLLIATHILKISST